MLSLETLIHLSIYHYYHYYLPIYPSTRYHGSYFAEVTLRVTGDMCSSSSMPSSSSDASSAYMEALLCRLNSCTYSDSDRDIKAGSQCLHVDIVTIDRCYGWFIVRYYRRSPHITAYHAKRTLPTNTRITTHHHIVSINQPTNLLSNQPTDHSPVVLYPCCEHSPR